MVPSVVVSSGGVICNVYGPYLSPYGPLAVGGGVLSQKPKLTDWPRPQGQVATFMKAMS